MAKLEDQRGAAYRKAEELLAQKQRSETERLSNRERDRRMQDEKIARLRRLRLAKEAEEQNAPKPAPRAGAKKPSKTA